MKTWGNLKPTTHLNQIFTDGKVPIKSVVPIIPREEGSPSCYLLDADYLSQEQIEALALGLYQMWQPECESVQMAIDYIHRGLPLNCEHFDGVTSTDYAVIAMLTDDYTLPPGKDGFVQWVDEEEF